VTLVCTALYSERWVDVVTDGQSAYSSWCRTHLWDPWSDFSFSSLLPDSCFAFHLGAPSLTKGRVYCTSIFRQNHAKTNNQKPTQSQAGNKTTRNGHKRGTKGRTSMTGNKQQSFWKQVLTPEDGQIRSKHVVVLEILKVTSVENAKKCFRHWQAAQNTEKEKWKWNNIVWRDANVQY
jgi:hypothetical protein